MSKYLFSSEAVFEGHPDKICDQVADRILDEALRQDSQARVACEVIANNNTLTIFGEITANANIEYEAIARDVIKEIGYTNPDLGFYYKTCKITCDIKKQSPDIAMGVESALEFNSQHSKCNKLGAGDQGIMFGYACNETQEFMPLPIMLANQISKEMDKIRKEKYSHIFGPDGKCQVSVVYENGRPKKVETIVVSAQTQPGVFLEKAEDIIINEVLTKVFDFDTILDAEVLINPTGEFVIGGPYADSGLDRKSVV